MWPFVVLCSRLLILCSHLLVVCGRSLVVCGRLLVVCGLLLGFAVVCARLCLLSVLVITLLKENFGQKNGLLIRP